MSIPHNPYVTGAPVDGDPSFVGRKDIFDQVRRLLQAKRPGLIVLEGPRRSGKTSTLRQLRHYLALDGMVGVYCNLEGLASYPLDDVLYTLASEIARQVDIKPVKREDINQRTFLTDFLPQAFRRLEEDKQQLVFLLDEFNALEDSKAPANATIRTLWPYLLMLRDKEPRLGMVFVYGRRTGKPFECATDVIFREATPVVISWLGYEETKELIRKPAQDNLEYPDETIDRIFALTGGHPHCIQLVCHVLWDLLVHEDTTLPLYVDLSDADIEAMIKQVIEQGDGAFNWCWIGFDAPQRVFLRAVAKATEEDSGIATKEKIETILREHGVTPELEEMRNAPGELVNWWNYLEEFGGSYRFTIELFRRWIIISKPLERARSDILLLSPPAQRHFQNAKEWERVGKLNEAKGEYIRALSFNPELIEAQLGLARMFFKGGEYDKTIDSYKKVRESVDPLSRDGWEALKGEVEARRARAGALAKSDRVQEAANEYDRILAIVPSDMEGAMRDDLVATCFGQGNMLLVQEHLDETLQAYKKALDLKPNDNELKVKVEETVEQYVKKCKVTKSWLNAGKALTWLVALDLNDERRERWLEDISLSFTKLTRESQVKNKIVEISRQWQEEWNTLAIVVGGFFIIAWISTITALSLIGWLSNNSIIKITITTIVVLTLGYLSYWLTLTRLWPKPIVVGEIEFMSPPDLKGRWINLMDYNSKEVTVGIGGDIPLDGYSEHKIQLKLIGQVEGQYLVNPKVVRDRGSSEMIRVNGREVHEGSEQQLSENSEIEITMPIAPSRMVHYQMSYYGIKEASKMLQDFTYRPFKFSDLVRIGRLISTRLSAKGK
jgi:tetratricopeptide (TPR) repeat protein